MSFVAYRQFVFDDNIIIYNMMTFDQLSIELLKSYITIRDDTIFIKIFNKKYLSKGEINDHIKQNFFNYNYTVRFSTYEERTSEFWFSLNCDFTNISSNFFKTLRKSK